MTQFQGNFKYFLDNKEITDINDLPTFYKTVKVDGSNVYFTSFSAPKEKINISYNMTKPFYLDEAINVLPEYKEASMEDILNGCYVKITGDKMFNIESIKNNSTCSPQCLCDGRCKKSQKTIQNTVGNIRKSFIKENKGIKDSQTIKKAPIFTFCKQMKHAIEALAFRSQYGHEKYKEYDLDWNNFARVENGDEEYGNAQFRHALGIGEDTELEHYVASAWDAIARLEIYLRENLDNKK